MPEPRYSFEKRTIVLAKDRLERLVDALPELNSLGYGYDCFLDYPIRQRLLAIRASRMSLSDRADEIKALMNFFFICGRQKNIYSRSPTSTRIVKLYNACAGYYGWEPRAVCVGSVILTAILLKTQVHMHRFLKPDVLINVHSKKFCWMENYAAENGWYPDGEAPPISKYVKNSARIYNWQTRKITHARRFDVNKSV